MEKYTESSLQLMRDYYQCLPERSCRHYAAMEALKLGYGGINYIREVLKTDRETIRKGIKELKESGEELPKNRQRKAGGGRKKNGIRQ